MTTKPPKRHPEGLIEAIDAAHDSLDFAGELVWILERGADPNEIDEKKLPLVYAAELGNEWIVKVLLDFGADPFLKDRFGKNAFDTGRKFRNVADVLRQWLEKNAGPDALPSESATAKIPSFGEFLNEPRRSPSFFRSI